MDVDPTPHALARFFPEIGVCAAAFLALFVLLRVTAHDAAARWFPKEAPSTILINFIATVHAVVVVIPSAYLILFSDHYSNHLLLDVEPIGAWTSCITAGYMLYDFVLLLAYPPGPLMFAVFAFHHVLAMITIWFCLTFKCSVLLVLIGLMFEASTPFLHCCKFCEAAEFDRTHRSFYKLCCGLCVLSFVLVRYPASIYQVITVNRCAPLILARDSAFQAAFIVCPYLFLTLNSLFMVMLFQKGRGVFFDNDPAAKPHKSE